MNHLFRILLLGALPLAAFPVIQASAQEPDIQTLLSAERSSFISGKARDILCRKLGTANLDTDKIRAMAHAPQVALLCHLYQFFSTAENGEPFTQHELKDESFRKWLSTHPEVFRMLALSGAAGTLRLYLETPRRTLENRQQYQRMELVNGKKPDTLERPRPAHPGLQCLHSSRSGGRILPDDGFI